VVSIVVENKTILDDLVFAHGILNETALRKSIGLM